MFNFIIQWSVNLGAIFAAGSGLYQIFTLKQIRSGIGFLIVLPALLFLGRFLYNKYLREKYQKNFLIFYEGIMVTILILGLIGEFFLYQIIYGWDTLIHLIDGFLLIFLTGLTAFVLYQTGVLKIHPLKIKPLIWIFIVGLLFGLLWEGYEFASDKLFGSQLWGDPFFHKFGSPIIDTLIDIIAQIIGAALGALIWIKKIPVWEKKWQKKY